MRWERLFADLEAQAESLAAAEFDGEVGERTRVEEGRLQLVDRLRPAVGHPVRVSCPGVGPLGGRLVGVGADWLLLTETPASETLVPLAATLSISGLGALSTVPGSEGRVGARLGLRHALRGLARDRCAVQAALVDGSTVAGTIDRVGDDFVEIAEHDQGEPRRAGSVRQVRTVPIGALALVRSW
jgi:hypothetical protein